MEIKPPTDSQKEGEAHLLNQAGLSPEAFTIGRLEFLVINFLAERIENESNYKANLVYIYSRNFNSKPNNRFNITRPD